MSIRIRLGLWYGGIFGIAMLVLGVLVYALMARHLESMVGDAVTGRANHLATAIRSSMQQAPTPGAVPIPPLDTFEASQVYVQVLSPAGAVLKRSSNLEDRTLAVPEGTLRQTEFPASLDGINMKVFLTPVTMEGQTVAWVQVAASYRDKELVMKRLRWVLFLGGPSIVAAVGLIGAALAGRALHPVSEMTETARAIALSRGFSRRLSAGTTGDELGQLAQTFNEMLASLEEAYSAQKRFTADASHELRAPLTAIRGNLDLLDRIRDMPEEEQQQTLNHARREVERLSRRVNDLLALSRADAGQNLEIGPVELDTLLLEVYRKALVMAHGVDVRLGHLEPTSIQADNDRLEELLLILVDNALRYTPKGGTVTLGLKLETPWVTVGVEDTGIGIERADLPHIFDRFWRADRARSRDSGGTGLGLAIAKWIVDRHGGEILVESTPGEGTRFSVRLPAPV